MGKVRPTPYWSFNCESCERCIAYCPQQAIQTGFLFLFVLYWIICGAAAFIPALAAAKLIASLPALSWLKNGLPFLLLTLAYDFLAVFLGYYLFLFVSRNAAVNRVFALTTPTRIFRRYNEPETTLKDLS
jgi:hypothetical protein